MEIYNFSYTGDYEFIELDKGLYLFQLWGASGGAANPSQHPAGVAGRGGHVSATLELQSKTNVYIFVGGKGGTTDSICSSSYRLLPGGFNGGGDVWTHAIGASGGGATDMRFDGNLSENRVLVAGGGGGGATFGNGGDGGDEIGGDASFNSDPSGHYYSQGLGGTQISGGNITQCSASYCVESDPSYVTGGFPNSPGSYGKGGTGIGRGCGGAGGGGGYYGGGGIYNVGGGGGGSSYAGSIFRSIKMIRGENHGDGKAVIIFLNEINLSCQSNILRIQLLISLCLIQTYILQIQ